jgi:hypothetical protein
MSLRFRYTHVATGQFITPLGGRTVRPRPLVPVSLVGPQDTAGWRAVLDTGADDTLFPESVASRIGIDLRNAPLGQGRGIGLNPVPVRYAEVTLRLTDGKERREWKGWVGFTPARLQYPLLGFSGVLQFFTATFFGDQEVVELTANGLYPGT